MPDPKKGGIFSTGLTTDFSFYDVTFVVGRGERKKTILRRVGASVSEGHVLAIMGPSGAGKTTLISTLTQEAHYGTSYGNVTLGSVPMSNSVFKQNCYVVQQQDSNWPHLTVREILQFASELYNNNDNREDLVRSIDGVLVKVGLTSAADTKSASLSGGQQRRLSLAVALLKRPKVMFLDEPTSGLDAASASAIMRELTAVAREENLIIICTIHQPSSKVFRDFDQVMLLSKGREAYVGKAEDSIGYFESLGYPLAQATSGAEHLLDIVNADFSTDAEVDTVLDTWNKNRTTMDKEALLPRYRTAAKSIGRSVQTMNIFAETIIMLRRSLLLTHRDPVLYVGRLVGFLIVNCVFGTVYIAARPYTQDQAINKLWVSAWYSAFPANMAVINTYKMNLELKAVLREQKNAMGSVASYVIAKTLLTIPIVFAFSVAALGVPGFVIQSYPLSTMVPFFFLWTAQISVWEASSEAMGAMFDDVITGLLVHTAWWFLALLFSGYLVPLDDLFWPLKIFYYILPNKNYVRSALFLKFSNQEWEPCSNPLSSPVCVDSTVGIDVMGSLDRVFALANAEDTYLADLLALLSQALVWKVISTAVILYKAHKVATMRKSSAARIHNDDEDDDAGDSRTPRTLLDEEVFEQFEDEETSKQEAYSDLFTKADANNRVLYSSSKPRPSIASVYDDPDDVG